VAHSKSRRHLPYSSVSIKAALAYLEEVAKRVLFAILFLVGLGFVRWAVDVRAASNTPRNYPAAKVQTRDRNSQHPMITLPVVNRL
jgi:hypothetical protein